MSDIAAAPHFTLSEMISCVRREIAMRRRVYPGWVHKGRMKLDGAEREIACMESILTVLMQLQAAQQPDDGA